MSKNEKKRKERIIATESFTTITSLKNSCIQFAINSSKNPEYFGFSKKGNIKSFSVKKNSNIIISISDAFALKVDNNSINYDFAATPSTIIINTDNDKNILNDKNGETTKDVIVTYKIKFSDFIELINSEIFKETAAIEAVNKVTGEVFKLYDVAKPIGYICDKDDKKIIQIRFNL